MSRCHAVLLFLTLKEKHFETVPMSMVAQNFQASHDRSEWAGCVFQALMALLPSMLGKLLQVPLPVDLADSSHTRKAFEKSKCVDKPMTEIDKGVRFRSFACRMLLTRDAMFRRDTAVWPKAHSL